MLDVVPCLLDSNDHGKLRPHNDRAALTKPATAFVKTVFERFTVVQLAALASVRTSTDSIPLLCMHLRSHAVLKRVLEQLTGDLDVYTMNEKPLYAACLFDPESRFSRWTTNIREEPRKNVDEAMQVYGARVGLWAPDEIVTPITTMLELGTPAHDRYLRRQKRAQSTNGKAVMKQFWAGHTNADDPDCECLACAAGCCDPHPEDCSCRSCGRHAEDCGCPNCGPHAEDCGCGVCAPHAEDCGCPNCAPRNGPGVPGETKVARRARLKQQSKELVRTRQRLDRAKSIDWQQLASTNTLMTQTSALLKAACIRFELDSTGSAREKLCYAERLKKHFTPLVDWVQCCDCEKWHTLPPSLDNSAVNEIKADDVWTCETATWGPFTCIAPLAVASASSAATAVAGLSRVARI